MILVRPRWEWNGKQWVFHDAGWAKPGTSEVVYRTTPAPSGPDVAIERGRTSGRIHHRRRTATGDDDRLRVDRRVCPAARRVSDLAPLLPLLLVSSAPVLRSAAWISQLPLQLRLCASAAVLPSQQPTSDPGTPAESGAARRVRAVAPRHHERAIDHRRSLLPDPRQDPRNDPALDGRPSLRTGEARARTASAAAAEAAMGRVVGAGALGTAAVETDDASRGRDYLRRTRTPT